MPSNLTAEDFKAVEDHLRKEYFLIRSQVVMLIAGLLLAAGVVSGWAGYEAMRNEAQKIGKDIARAEAENAARSVLATHSAKVATDEILGLRNASSDANNEIVKLRDGAKAVLVQIRSKSDESAEIVKGLDPRLKTLEAKTAGLKADGVSGANLHLGNGWRIDFARDPDPYIALIQELGDNKRRLWYIHLNEVKWVPGK